MSYTIPARDTLIWAAVDLDGTLAEQVWPDAGIGDPIWRNVRKLDDLERRGYKIVIHTARGWECYELIESWLNHHDIPFSRIVCGKVLAAVYVDDRAVHSDRVDWLPQRAFPALSSTLTAQNADSLVTLSDQNTSEVQS